MAINHGLIRAKREEKGIGRGDFAEQLGISYNYLYRIEKGLKIPSRELLEKISRLIEVPAKTLMLDPTLQKIEGGYFEQARDYMDVLQKLHRERHFRKNLDERNFELERQIEHLTALLYLHLQIEDILLDKDLSQNEKWKKIEALAIITANEGEITFNDMLTAFRIKRVTLKKWLDAAKHVYQCKCLKSRETVAATPGEAALRLCCYDCEHFESLECDGYDNETRPENLIELLVRLEANGIYNRREQCQLLEESYGLNISEHELSEIVYRYKNGKKLPEGAFNLEIRR